MLAALADLVSVNAGVPGSETPVTATVADAVDVTVLLSGAVALNVALLAIENEL
jgi:hypothetical protein